MIKDLFWYIIDTFYMWYTTKRLDRWIKTLPPKKSLKETDYMLWLQFNDPKEWYQIVVKGEKNDYL